MRFERWQRILPLRLRSLFYHRSVERELDEELRYHLERQTEYHISHGLTPEEARYAAHRMLGGIDQHKETCRDTRGISLIEDCLKDIRYGLQTLVRNPTFSIITIGTLALVIGANTAIFSIVSATLIPRLPYPNPDQLVSIESSKPSGSGTITVSPADFKDWREQSTSAFADFAAYNGTGVTFQTGDHPETVSGARVTDNFFTTLSARPLLGRGFNSAEGLSNGPRSLVLSQALWLSRFGGDPAIVGRQVSTSAGPVTVVGVMPSDFRFPAGAEAWVPIYRDTPEMDRRSSRYWLVFGRLRSGQSIEAGRAELRSIAGRLAAAYPKDDQGWTVRVTPLAESRSRGFRSAVLTLMGAVLLVLLIACANVSGLVLARSTARRREIAIRMALGASHRRIARQCVVEGLLVSLLGAAAGLAVAHWTIGALFSLLPGTNLLGLSALRDEVQLNSLSILFTVLISIAAGAVFALIPTLHARQLSLSGSLHAASFKTRTRADNRIHKVLVIVQFACAVVLLVGAGLLIRSFVRMLHVDYGYNPADLIVMNLPQPAQNGQQFLEQTLERIQSLPGVESASLMSFATLGGLNFPFNIESRPLATGDAIVRYSSVSASYFHVLKTRLIAGRTFDDRDSENAPGVAVINETLAHQYFGGENPVGQRVSIAYLNRRIVREIIGVVSDIRQDSPQQPVQPEILVHWRQLPWLGANVLIQSQGKPANVARAVQDAIWSIDKNIMASNPRTMEETLGVLVAEPRLYAVLLGTFAIAATLLAMMGIYGLLNYIVNRRMQEMAVRMAIGARASDVVRSVIGEGMRLSALGIAAGFCCALAFSRLIESLLFGVTPADPVTLFTVAAVLLFAAFLACYFPARRATHADPIVVLRHE